jgi:hypothetical protein
MTRSAAIDEAELAMLGLGRRQQDGPKSLTMKASLKRSLSRGSGTFKREQSLRGMSDNPALSNCIVLSPNEADLLSSITEAIKDVLTVTSWGARPLSSYPDVKSMLRDMFGSNLGLGLSPVKAPGTQLIQDTVLALPGPQPGVSLKINDKLAHTPSKLRTLSFGVIHNFISSGAGETNVIAPMDFVDDDDGYNADDPLGILKGNFGGGFQSGSRMASLRGGSSFRAPSAAILTQPPYSPFEVIKRVLGKAIMSLISNVSSS